MCAVEVPLETYYSENIYHKEVPSRKYCIRLFYLTRV